MKPENTIYNIGVDLIHPHPDNPRKNLGDLSEMTESVKKKGVMQNLTVIPHPDKPGEYMVLIGHRRLASAKEAGIQEVPCRIIEDITYKEQISTMLEENMQRNDLTIYEQAQGFQMMLDLGDTEDVIAEKTGFSRTTIRHRLNIAKLNQNELKKKEQDEVFQLTLNDLYALEKVQSIKTRNKILKEAGDSRSLRVKAQQAADEEKRTKKEKSIINMLKEKGIEPAPKGVEDERWSAKWITVKEYDLDKDVPKKLMLKVGKEKLFYVRWFRTIHVIKKVKKSKEAEPEWKVKETQKKKRRRRIMAKIKEMAGVRKEFIRSILTGEIEPLDNTDELQKILWEVMIKEYANISSQGMLSVFLDKEYWNCTQEEIRNAKEKVDKLDITYQMLALMPSIFGRNEILDYKDDLKKTEVENMKTLYKALELFGFSLSEEDQQMLDGTHEVYARED